MIKLKLYGLLRLDCGLKELELDISSTAELMGALDARLLELGREAQHKKLQNFIVTVNGKPVKGKVPLKDGDEVCLLSAVAGG